MILEGESDVSELHQSDIRCARVPSAGRCRRSWSSMLGCSSKLQCCRISHPIGNTVEIGIRHEVRIGRHRMPREEVKPRLKGG